MVNVIIFFIKKCGKLLYMLPSLWGMFAWQLLHTIAFEAGDMETTSAAIREQYKLFFESLAVVLPCQQCRHHYLTHLESDPIDPINLIKWVNNTHNYVNEMKGETKWTDEMVMDKYFVDGTLRISHAHIFK